MAYATKTQVAEEAKVNGGFSATTLPSATKVDEIIAEEEAKIDVAVGKVYTLPLVAAASLILMRSISVALCAERVKGITEVSGLGPENDQRSTSKSGADRARKMLEEIEAGTFPLAGEVALSSSGGIGFQTGSDDCDDSEPVFKKGCDQW